MDNQSKMNLIGKNFSNIDEDIIDLKALFIALIRKKKLIQIITGCFIVLSGFYAFRQERIWKGQFQIVIEKKKEEIPMGVNSAVASLIKGNGRNQNIQTQVEILKSPSVLMDVFEYVKEYKDKRGYDTKNMRYQKWQEEKLKIVLKKYTSVLDISYKDSSKDLILDVLNKISNTYQVYSKKSQSKSIISGIKYLDQQIPIYREKRLIALKEAKDYSTNNNILLSEKEGKEKDIVDSLSLDVERNSNQAFRKIKEIKEVLRQLEKMQDDDESLLYIAKANEDIVKAGLTKKINDLDIDISILRSKYNPNDISLRRAYKKRKILLGILKDNMYSYLKSKQAQQEIKISISNRPVDVIVKYIDLLTVAQREKKTVDNLLTQKRTLLLEQARSTEPWSLITKPTLQSNPIAPRKKLIIFLGSLIGISLGSVAAIFIDKKEDIIYEESELEDLLGKKMLVNLSCKNTEEYNELINLFIEGVLNKIKDPNIALITLKNSKLEDFQKIKSSLISFIKNDNILITDSLIKANDQNIKILVFQNGKVIRKEILKLKNKIDMQNKPILGFILI